MNKTSIKWFWYVLFFMAFFVNENLVQWALAVIVGHFNVLDGFKDAFKFFTFNSYVFFTSIRLIPYLLLGGIVLILVKKQKAAAVGVSWGGLFGVSAMIIYGSWSSLHSLYSGGHVSSTTGLVFLVLPFFAIISGVIGGLIGRGISFLYEDGTRRETES
jgi:hypothetical protein